VVAAPVFSEVMQVALASRRVVPDGVDVDLEQVIAQTQAEADALEGEDGEDGEDGAEGDDGGDDDDQDDEVAPERAAGPTPSGD
jgi:hypothetical protein